MELKQLLSFFSKRSQSEFYGHLSLKPISAAVGCKRMLKVKPRKVALCYLVKPPASSILHTR